jgi:hypothetical protein
MARFTREELKKRSFYRAAWVLHHFFEEQRDEYQREKGAWVHSRLFDTLVHAPLILAGTSIEGHGHIEHLVPCALIRDHAFEMYQDGKTVDDVADMIGRYLRIAYITPKEARQLDYELGLKTTMPDEWRGFETGGFMERLEKADITLIPTTETEKLPWEL